MQALAKLRIGLGSFYDRKVVQDLFRQDKTLTFSFNSFSVLYCHSAWVLISTIFTTAVKPLKVPLAIGLRLSTSDIWSLVVLDLRHGFTYRIREVPLPMSLTQEDPAVARHSTYVVEV